MGTEKVLSDVRDNAKRYESEMIDWLKIESVSSDPKRNDQTRKAAEWLAKKLQDMKIENVKLIETGLHPLVYGDWLHAKDKPTILVGFSQPSGNIHSPNERFKLENFHKGIATCIHLYNEFANERPCK